MELEKVHKEDVFVIITGGDGWTRGRIGEAYKVTRFCSYAVGFKAYVDVGGKEMGIWMGKYRFPDTLEEYEAIRKADLVNYNETQKLKEKISKAKSDILKYQEKLNKLKCKNR